MLGLPPDAPAVAHAQEEERQAPGVGGGLVRPLRRSRVPSPGIGRTMLLVRRAFPLSPQLY